jgi:hypothetical protein
MSKANRQFPSIAAAAAAMGVSETLLKDATRLGCDGFKARGSVNEASVVKFIAEHEAELVTGGVALRDQKLTEEIRKLRIKNDKDAKLSVPVESVKQCIARILARVDQILEQKLCNEYPSAVAGLDVPQARIYGKRLGDQIRAEMNKLKEEWK